MMKRAILNWEFRLARFDAGRAIPLSWTVKIKARVVVVEGEVDVVAVVGRAASFIRWDSDGKVIFFRGVQQNRQESPPRSVARITTVV
jgi:hypothetical protein